MSCTFEMTDPGPHPGCREFDPNPALFTCSAEAVVNLTLKDPVFGEVETLGFCLLHAQYMLDENGEYVQSVDAL